MPELELRAQFEQRLTEVSVPMDSKECRSGAGRSLLTCDRVFSVVLLVEGKWRLEEDHELSLLMVLEDDLSWAEMLPMLLPMLTGLGDVPWLGLGL